MADRSVAFLQRQKELCLLSSFIAEQEAWLNDWVSALGWTLQGLEQSASTDLVQCPFNANHFVPSSALKEHSEKCQYATLLGTDISKVDWEESGALKVGAPFLYQNSSVEVAHVDQPVVNAVKKLAGNLPKIEQLVKSRKDQARQEQFLSLEETESSPIQFQFKDAPQMISYIKSWKRIPINYAQIDSSSLNLGKVKGWLFKHLPVKHTHSAVLGGEITIVESIMACLTPSSRGKSVALSPNVLVNKLQPLLGLNARSLVLDLMKYLHISRVQGQHGLSDTFVSEIAPMPQAMAQEVKGGTEEQLPSIAELLADYMERDGSPEDSSDVHLPPDHVIHQLSTSERRILYDYVVEVTSGQALLKLDPDLYRDDMAVLKARLKTQAKSEAGKEKEEVDTKGKTFLQLLKEKRDYKRRRQKYRARNVHITRRTPTEIFRTIIGNRMEELRRSLGDDGGTVPTEEAGPSEGASTRLRSRSRERDRQETGSRKRERSRSEERGERRDHKRSRKHSRRSRSRGKRSRSRERRRRSPSRERGRRRSRSRERAHKHKKHKKRSRSRS